MPLTLPPKASYRLGVLSDTHGSLPQRVLQIFAGVDAILHAGDIGSLEILLTLEGVAPVLAVRGNMDGAGWAQDLAEQETLRAGNRMIRLIHDRLRLEPQAVSARFLAVVTGHTHRAAVEKKNGVLYLNPGSVGAPRGGEPPCVARMVVTAEEAAVEIIPI